MGNKRRYKAAGTFLEELIFKICMIKFASILIITLIISGCCKYMIKGRKIEFEFEISIQQ
jgi:hypothetical protein